MSTMMTESTAERILLAHGGGGELTGRLIADHVLPRLGNEVLDDLGDSAVLRWTAPNVVFTTDSYVVSPLEFPGGDIGRLAVCGTVNDLSVAGAEPVALSLGLILEEGLPIDLLDRITESIARAADEAGIHVVTGDTKVIDRQGGTGLFINTAGIGHLRPNCHLDLTRVEPGDCVIVSGTIADHGLTIMSKREGIEFDSDLCSDAAPLNGLIDRLFDAGVDVRFMRDATRGGLAGVLADMSERARLTIEIEECRIPMSRTSRHAAEMLGFDPLTVANEGKAVFAIARQDASRAVSALRDHRPGSQAQGSACCTERE